ncbi:MAG: hypothetical protein WC761_05475 [Candidatus Paceibacterota bacterium]|jgi:hypothetical protein
MSSPTPTQPALTVNWWKIARLLFVAVLFILAVVYCETNKFSWYVDHRILIVLVTLVLLAIYVIWQLISFYINVLPKLLESHGARERFICKREENTWIPIEDGGSEAVQGQFQRAVLVCNGKKLETDDRDSAIISGNENLPPEPFTGFKVWLRKKSYEWIGFHSPTITKRGYMKIKITCKKYGLSSKKPVDECVEEKNLVIRNLRLDFPVFILVREIELSDGSLAWFLYRAQVRITCPGKFWYVQSGSGFESLHTALDHKINMAIQVFSLDEFYEGEDGDKGVAHRKIDTDLNDPAKQIEIPGLGLIVDRIDRDSWTNNASEDYIKFLKGPAMERVRQKTEEARAEAEKARETAEKAWADAEMSRGGMKDDENNQRKLALEIALAGKSAYQTRLTTTALKEAFTGNNARVFAPGMSIFDAFMANKMDQKTKSAEQNENRETKELKEKK